jgi:hypothetical protein
MGRRILLSMMVLMLLMSAVTVMFASTGTVSAADPWSGGFSYTVDSNNNATITGYNGTSADVDIPSTIGGYNVAAIGESAFNGNGTITSVIIPDSVTSIGSLAFYYCGNLRSVAMGNNVITIGGGAFTLCLNLASIVIPDSVTSIGNNAFFQCPSLTTIVIPNSVTSIGMGAFGFCYQLVTILFDGNAPTVDSYWIDNHNAALTIYYNASATGFTTPSWSGVPCYPLSPLDLTATSVDGTVTLTWNEPLYAGGSAIDHYAVYVDGAVNQTVESTTAVIAGLTNGRMYSFNVMAYNEAGYGWTSNTIKVIPLGLEITSPVEGSTKKPVLSPSNGPRRPLLTTFLPRR